MEKKCLETIHVAETTVFLQGILDGVCRSIPRMNSVHWRSAICFVVCQEVTVRHGVKFLIVVSLLCGENFFFQRILGVDGNETV